MDDSNMTPKERTQRMLKEARKMLVDHEKESRANEGKYQFSLKTKMFYTLPLVTIVVALFSFSFYYSKKLGLRILEERKNSTMKVEDAINAIKSYEETDELKDEIELDDEFLNDDNKKW